MNVKVDEQNVVTEQVKPVTEPVTEKPKPVDKVGEVSPETKKELQRLLDSEPPKLQTVTVRCNRQTGQWDIYEGDKVVESVAELTLMNVTFTSKQSTTETYTGCGGSYLAMIGFATGDRLPGTPKSLPSTCKIGFEPAAGKFYSIISHTGRWISGADYLIMSQGCHAKAINPKYQ